jgi:hypothetical protein
MEQQKMFFVNTNHWGKQKNNSRTYIDIQKWMESIDTFCIFLFKGSVNLSQCIHMKWKTFHQRIYRTFHPYIQRIIKKRKTEKYNLKLYLKRPIFATFRWIVNIIPAVAFNHFRHFWCPLDLGRANLPILSRRTNKKTVNIRLLKKKIKFIKTEKNKLILICLNSIHKYYYF